MRDIVKDYVENCIEMAKTSIKIHKKFLGHSNGFWLEDAEKYTTLAEMALDYNMLPVELRQKRLEWFPLLGE